MATEAGKAFVKFDSDFSALDASVLAEVKKLSGVGGDLGKVFVGTTVAVGAAGVAVLDLATKYETSTDRIAAKANITKAAAKAIGDEFLTTGGKSTFTAQQMVDAFAPVSGQLQQLVHGTLNSADALEVEEAAAAGAEATHGDLNETTAALTRTLLAFGDGPQAAAGDMDILTNAANATNQAIPDVSDAVDKLKGKLGEAAPTLADSATLVVGLNNAGLTGSRAVIGMTRALQQLLDPNKAASKEVKALGLNVYDANGEFVGMSSVIGQLQPKLEAMTPKQRELALTTLFGAQQAQAMNAIISDGAAAFDKQSAALAKAGSAQDAAAKATDNLAGQWDRTKSLLMDSLVQLGTFALPAVTAGLKDVTQFGGDVISDLEGVHTATSDTDGAARNFANTLKDVGGFIKNDVLPPLEGFVGFMGDHINVVEGFAGGIAALYAAKKVGGLLGGAIDDLKGLYGAGQNVMGLFSAGGGGSAISKLAPAHVWVDNMGLGGGAPGVAGKGGAAAEDAAAAGAVGLADVPAAGWIVAAVGTVLGALGLSGIGKDIYGLSQHDPSALNSQWAQLNVGPNSPAAKGDLLGGIAQGLDLPMQFLAGWNDLFAPSSGALGSAAGGVATGTTPALSALSNVPHGPPVQGIQGIGDPAKLAAGQTAQTQGEFAELLKTGVLRLHGDVNNYLKYWSQNAGSAQQQATEHAALTKEFQAGHIKNAPQLEAFLQNWDAVSHASGDAATQQQLMDGILANYAPKASGSAKDFATDMQTLHEHTVGAGHTLDGSWGYIGDASHRAVGSHQDFARDMSHLHDGGAQMSDVINRGAIDTKSFAALSAGDQKTFLRLWDSTNLSSQQILVQIQQASMNAQSLPTAIGRLDGSINDAAAAAAELKGHFSIAGALGRGVSGQGGGGGYTAGAEGMWIEEPVAAVGASGHHYVFGEAGRERLLTEEDYLALLRASRGGGGRGVQIGAIYMPQADPVEISRRIAWEVL